MSPFPKALFGGVLAALGIAACGSSSNNSSLGDQPILTGQIDGWTQGAGFTLQASLINIASAAPPLATTAIDAAGHFSIALPGSSSLAPYLFQQHYNVSEPATGCVVNNLQVSPLDFATVELSLTATSGNIRLPVNQVAPPSTGILYIYVDRDLNKTGNFTCTFGATQMQETIDIHFGVGWNQQVRVINSTNATGNTSSNAIPSGTKWVTQ